MMENLKVLFSVLFYMLLICACMADVMKFQPRFFQNTKLVENDHEIAEVVRSLMKLHTIPERFRSDDEILKMGGNPANKLQKFKWEDCGGNGVSISELDITDPLSFPGNINISANFTINTLLVHPLQIKVVLKKKIGPLEIEIPCIDNVGSCTYYGCKLLATIKKDQCPKILTNQGFNCSCPIQQGQIVIPNVVVSTAALPEHVPSGDYQVEAKIYHGAKQEIKCLKIGFSVK